MNSVNTLIDMLERKLIKMRMDAEIMKGDVDCTLYGTIHANRYLEACNEIELVLESFKRGKSDVGTIE